MKIFEPKNKILTTMHTLNLNIQLGPSNTQDGKPNSHLCKVGNNLQQFASNVGYVSHLQGFGGLPQCKNL